MQQQGPLQLDPDETPYDMRPLLQLALWGVSAAGALGLAAVAASSASGSHRLLAVLQGRAEQPANAVTAPPTPIELAARADAEKERRRLVQSVRALSADRDRLMTRVSALEHGLEDMTGSINRQAEAIAPAAPATTTATGVDIGAATSFDGLRALWKSIAAAHPDLFNDLQPVVVAREADRARGVELRLIAGPLADAEAAERLCGALTAAHRSCQPAQFAGQKLSLVPPPRRRPPVAEHKPAPGPPVVIQPPPRH